MRTARDNFWLDMPYQAGPALWGEHDADVCVIGGGFTGMASAYFIKQRFPGKRVIVLESEFVGYGSSGRNSGIATGMLGNSCLLLKKKHGTEEATRLQKLASQSVSLFEELMEKHRVDCDYEKVGRLVLAENGKAAELLVKEAAVCKEVGARVKLLDREQARGHFAGLNAAAGVYTPDEGMLNPAKFVRGMKRAVESLGVEVYEHSRCTHIEAGPVASLFTSSGHVKAKAIVVATNAYSNPLGLFRHKVLPLYVYNIVTEPLTQAQLDEFGWAGRAPVFNQKTIFWMMRLTADNRLLFINNNALYFYDVDRDYSHCPREYQRHYEMLIRLFPFLKGIKVKYAWGGRIGMTLDFLPSIGCTGKHKNIFYSIGYNGHGLALGQLAGKMLAELMAGEKTELTDHILINKSIWGFPSAPLMYVGINAYKSYYKMCDRLLDVGK